MRKPEVSDVFIFSSNEIISALLCCCFSSWCIHVTSWFESQKCMDNPLSFYKSITAHVIDRAYFTDSVYLSNLTAACLAHLVTAVIQLCEVYCPNESVVRLAPQDQPCRTARPGVANQSETKSDIFYCVATKNHIIHMGAHEHHPISSSLTHMPLLSYIYCKYCTPAWQWQNFARRLLLCLLFSGHERMAWGCRGCDCIPNAEKLAIIRAKFLKI